MKAPTVEEIRKRTYGPGYSYLGGGYQTYYNYSKAQCAAAVIHMCHETHQCTRKPGHGPHGAFCKQHAKQYEVCDD